MATDTGTVTYDDISLHAVIVPIACQRMTLRQRAQDAPPALYDVAAPQSSNAPFRKFPGEPVVFEALPGTYLAAGATPGYIQPVGATITFSFICE